MINLEFIQQGADPTWENDNGTTVLSLIIKRGQYNFLRTALTSIGPERGRMWLNAPMMKSGWTALMAAANGRDMRIVQLLLTNEADPNQAMGTGWTALHTAAKIDYGSSRSFILGRKRGYYSTSGTV